MAASDHTCLTEGCGKTATLQCPTCIKLKIEGSYFCSQDCFKKNWVRILHFFCPIIVLLIICVNRVNTSWFIRPKLRVCRPVFALC